MKSGTLFLFHHHKIGNRRSFNETVNSYLSWTKRSSLSFLFQVVLRSFVSRTAANIIQKTHISLVYTQSNDRKNNSILHNNRLTTIKLMLKQRNHASKFLKSGNGFEFPMSNHVWSNFMKFRFSRCFFTLAPGLAAVLYFLKNSNFFEKNSLLCKHICFMSWKTISICNRMCIGDCDDTWEC